MAKARVQEVKGNKYWVSVSVSRAAEEVFQGMFTCLCIGSARIGIERDGTLLHQLSAGAAIGTLGESVNKIERIPMAKKIGVLLSGCGVFDGTEIHEAVLTLLFLDRAGVSSHLYGTGYESVARDESFNAAGGGRTAQRAGGVGAYRKGGDSRRQRDGCRRHRCADHSRWIRGSQES